MKKSLLWIKIGHSKSWMLRIKIWWKRHAKILWVCSNVVLELWFQLWASKSLDNSDVIFCRSSCDGTSPRILATHNPPMEGNKLQARWWDSHCCNSWDTQRPQILSCIGFFTMPCLGMWSACCLLGLLKSLGGVVWSSPPPPTTTVIVIIVVLVVVLLLLLIIIIIIIIIIKQVGKPDFPLLQYDRTLIPASRPHSWTFT